MIIPIYTVGLLEHQIEEFEIELGDKRQLEDDTEIAEIESCITELNAVIALLHTITVFDDTLCLEGCDGCKKFEDGGCGEWQ